MSTTPGDDPQDDPRILSTINLGGMRSPGVVTLTGFDREQTLDVKESDGQKGATTTWKGEKCGKGTATFYLVTNDEIDEIGDWAAFAEMLESTVPPKSGKKPVAKDVYHPDLARNHYTSLILAKMGKMRRDGHGGAEIAVELSEYYPPKAAAAGGASGSKSTPNDPNDPIKQASDELNNLLKTASSP